MVGVIIIAVVFLGFAIGIALAASQGKLGALGRIVNTNTRGANRTLYTTLAVVYFVFMIVVPLIFIIGNRDRSNAQVGGVRLTASMQNGRELFAEHCAVCHTLAAANAVGKTGPNLDTLKPDKQLILTTIATGCVQKPSGITSKQTCLGFGTMPPDIVQSRDAQDVAQFVAKVAGHV